MPVQPLPKEMEAEGDSAAEMNGEEESEDERSGSQSESEEESSGNWQEGEPRVPKGFHWRLGQYVRRLPGFSLRAIEKRCSHWCCLKFWLDLDAAPL